MLTPGAIVLEIALLAGPVAGVTDAGQEGPPRPAAIVDQDEIDLASQSNIVLGVGARALGMGGAFLARPDDATAATWNPAGLSYLRRPEVSIVGDILRTESSLRATTGNLQQKDRTTVDIGNLDFVAVTYPFSLGGNGGSAQVSYQRAIPFDLDRTTTTEVSQLGEAPTVTTERYFDGAGGFDVLAFGFGARITREVRLGATLNRWFNGYEQSFERRVSRRATRYDRFEISAWNVNAGVIWSPTETLNLAVVGKTPFTADASLYRERTDFVTGLPDIGPFQEESDDLRLEFPGAWGVGASWRPRNNLTVSSDYTRTYWSKARIRNYFTLTVVEGEEVVRPFDSLVWPNVDAEAQADSIQLRFGVEYVVFAGRVKVPLRLGYVNEQIYTLDYRGKAPNLSSFTAGTGLIAGSALLDVAYQYQDGAYYLPGINYYTTKTHRFYASLIYRWGGPR